VLVVVVVRVMVGLLEMLLALAVQAVVEVAQTTPPRQVAMEQQILVAAGAAVVQTLARLEHLVALAAQVSSSSVTQQPTPLVSR